MVENKDKSPCPKCDGTGKVPGAWEFFEADPVGMRQILCSCVRPKSPRRRGRHLRNPMD
jgi:hypothetical protein